jgi:hypothetical protein
MRPEQKALLDRLRVLIEETPKSGALNAGKRPLYITRFAQAVERRSDDGDALVAYVRSKVHDKATSSYNALVAVDRLDLTVEALVADRDAAWAPEFTEEDREAAHARIGTMVETLKEARDAAEQGAVAQDRKIIAAVNERRRVKGKPPMTPEQEADLLAKRAGERAPGARS